MKNNIFNHDNPYTIGVEEEYMLCDPSNGELINKADEIIKSLLPQFKNRFSYELLLSEIEINTSICNSVSEAVNELVQLRNYVKTIGLEKNFKIAISGTHPTAKPIDQSFVISNSYNWVSEQLHYYARRNITFATHIHIAVPSRDVAIHVTNSLRQWIAPLLALSTNSPFFEGVNTKFKSARTMQFGSFPRTESPPFFKSYEHYEKIINQYLLLDSIANPRQVWWKIRPHMNFGTIEFRMLDAQRSLKRTEMFIAIAQALVYQSVKDYNDGILKESLLDEFISDSIWKASRFDLNALIMDDDTKNVISIKDKIFKMIKYVKPALKFFKNDSVIDIVLDIMKNGTEADMQLDTYKNSGFNGLKNYLINDVQYKL